MNMDNVEQMLRDRASLKVSIIGVGNAGNQFLNPAVKAGYDVFAINSSQKDLDNAITSKQTPSFIVGREGRGAGKIRSKAVELFKENGAELFSNTPYFKEMCERSDVIIVTGAAAGGTGSGICPSLITLLQRMYPDKIVIYFGILPRLTDSVNAQENTVACLREIFDLKIPYMLADLDYYQGVPNDIAYQQVQEFMLDCVNTLAGKYLKTSPFGMIDENDMRMIIKAPGYMSVYHLQKINQAMLDRESMQQKMIGLINRSPAAQIQRDKIIQNFGVIVDISADLGDSVRAGDYEELTKHVGRPLSTYENYVPDGNGTTGQMILILSGQTAPLNRVEQMIEISKEAADTQKNQKDFRNLMDDAVSGSITQNRSLPTRNGLSEAEKDSAISDFFNS